MFGLETVWKRCLKWERRDKWSDENVKHVISRAGWIVIVLFILKFEIDALVHICAWAWQLESKSQLWARKNRVTNSFYTKGDETAWKGKWSKDAQIFQAIHLMMTVIRGSKRKQFDWCLQYYQKFLRTLTWLMLKRKCSGARSMHSNIAEKNQKPLCVRIKNS